MNNSRIKLLFIIALFYSFPLWNKIGAGTLHEVIYLYIISILLIPLPLVLNIFLGYRLNSEPARISKNALSNANKKIKSSEHNITESASKIIFRYPVPCYFVLVNW